jgi:putative phage-type endonuclease
MKIIALEQNTPEWLEWRKGGIGGSDAPAIMGVSPWDSPLSLWQRRMGLVPQKVMSMAMQRGHELEPIARALLEKETGLVFAPMCGEHKKFGFLKASFDGVSFCRTALAEIKAPNLKDHANAIGVDPFDAASVVAESDEDDDEERVAIEEEHALVVSGLIPPKYWPQVQHQMMVSGIKKTFYCSYYPGHPVRELAIVVVHLDKPYCEKLFKAEKLWWDCLMSGRMPVSSAAVSRAIAWRESKTLADQYLLNAKEAQRLLIEDGGIDVLTPQSHDFGVAKVSVASYKGGIDYDRLIADLGVTQEKLEEYRGESSVRVSFRKTNHLRTKVTREQLLKESASSGALLTN